MQVVHPGLYSSPDRLTATRTCNDSSIHAFRGRAKGGGEFIFGAVRGDLDCRYGPDGVRFTWEGFDEMDPAFGAGSAKLAPDGSLTGEIRFHGGDESTFKARRW
jgi:hypothetical protein